MHGVAVGHIFFSLERRGHPGFSEGVVTTGRRRLILIRRRSLTVLIPFRTDAHLVKSGRHHNNHQERDLHCPNPMKHCERTLGQPSISG